ncbi:hypothetical protein [Microbacterium sp. MPKO10]|uniref:VG15 protein n=1 Tax=Microbacterium sp. MPKO10 TaxID=2989818 RepID=UPI0022354526|nr:hypothetical protein [Microbacterium sp. MPKO10]MCW4458179.1 hypothetical protein [Microbacterium sp. MPKO10]
MAQNDIGSYAQSIADEDPAKVAGQLREATPAVVATYGDVAATSGALFYENNRPKPGYNARLATPSIGEALTGELGWALVPLFKPDVFLDPASEMLGRVMGVTQKFVAQYDRDTLSLNSSLDSLSLGVRRYARADACTFCAYLTSIDATVHADTDWHNHCHCVSVPWWEDNPLPTNPKMDEWSDAAQKAEKELMRLRAETPRNGMKRKQYFAQHPELALNRKNILRIMRRELGLSH